MYVIRMCQCHSSYVIQYQKFSDGNIKHSKYLEPTVVTSLPFLLGYEWYDRDCQTTLSWTTGDNTN